MSLDVYRDMLLEEIDRKKRALSAFNNDNKDKFPVYFKNVKGSKYLYINDGKKGEFHYKLIGNINSFSKPELDKLLKNSDKYYMNLNSICEIRDDLLKLERMVKILDK